MSQFSEILTKNSMQDMLQSIQESFTGYGLDMTDDTDFRSMMSDAVSRETYVSTLSEGLGDKDAKTFEMLCENIIQANPLSEANTSASFIPQAKLVMPLFRFMWPRLIMKEFVNVVPMDAPEIVRYFFRPVAYTDNGTQVELPSYNAIGTGIAVGTWTTPASINVGTTANIITGATYANLPAGTKATVQRGFVFATFTGVDKSNVAVTGDIKNGQVDEEGKFSFKINVGTAAAPDYDTVSGYVNFDSGDVVVSSLYSGTYSAGTHGAVTSVGFIASVSLAEYNNATKITFDPRKIRFMTEDMQLQAEWSIQWEQDQRARMGLDVQAEFIAVFGNQIQLNIDSLMLNDIIFNITKYNSSNIETFSRTPNRAAFAYTLKDWALELLPKIETVSAKIYNDTNLMPASHIIANPKDLVWLKMLNEFDFKGHYDKDGQMGSSPVVGTFANSYTVLCSPIVPANNIIIGAKPSQDSFANYIFSPYIPILLTPYPLSTRPAMTVTSRFSRKMLRPEGYGMITLTN